MICSIAYFPHDAPKLSIEWMLGRFDDATHKDFMLVIGEPTGTADVRYYNITPDDLRKLAREAQRALEVIDGRESDAPAMQPLPALKTCDTTLLRVSAEQNKNAD
jgi:hypothetical protein